MPDLAGPLAEFIVGESRRGRGVAGMTQEAFGRKAGFSASHVSAVESGTRALTMAFVRGADRALETGGIYERLVTRFGAPSWFRQWLDAEQTAIQLCCFHPNLIPGLLQTADYARAVLRLAPRLTEDEVEARVVTRLERQEILARDHPPQLIVVMNEAAIRQAGEGCAKLMPEQLLHLRRCAERPSISVHVVPSNVGLHAGLSGPLLLGRMADNSWTGHLENQLGGTVVDRPEDLDTLLERWESIRNEALSRQQSLALIEEVMNSWI